MNKPNNSGPKRLARVAAIAIRPAAFATLPIAVHDVLDARANGYPSEVDVSVDVFPGGSLFFERKRRPYRILDKTSISRAD